ncbi:MAG: hypothetical protein R3B54_06115 [Bdellovibrionota bacterium]
MAKIFVSMLLLGVTLTCLGQDLASPEDPRRVLSALKTSADRIESFVRLLSQKYPKAKEAIHLSMYGPVQAVPKDYVSQFNDLFLVPYVVQTPFGTEKRVEYRVYRFPERLKAATSDLNAQWAKPGVGESALATSFRTVDYSYWRSLAASYTFIRYAKLQYFYAGSPFLLTGEKRSVFETEMRGLHQELQVMMGLMRTLRTDSRFGRLQPGKYTPYSWEDTYGALYYFNRQFDIVGNEPVNELVYYLVPAAYPNLPTGMRVVPLPG